MADETGSISGTAARAASSRTKKFPSPGYPTVGELAAWKAEATEGLEAFRVDASPTLPLHPGARRDPFATLFDPNTAPLLQSMAADTRLSRTELDMRRALESGVTIAGSILGGAIGSSLMLQTREGKLNATLCAGETQQQLPAGMTDEEMGKGIVHLPDGRELSFNQGYVTVRDPDSSEVEAHFDTDNRLMWMSASFLGGSVTLDMDSATPALILAKEDFYGLHSLNPHIVQTASGAADPHPSPSLTEMARVKERTRASAEGKCFPKSCCPL